MNSPNKQVLENSGQIIDIRNVECMDKFQTVFDSFDALAPGEFFILVNEFAPEPLKHQIATRRTDGFSWEYLDSEPGFCRIRIGKTA